MIERFIGLFNLKMPRRKINKKAEKLFSTKRVLMALGAILFLVIVVVAREKIADAWRLIGQVNVWWLVLAFSIQVPSYYFVAKNYQTLLMISGFKPDFRKLFELSFALNFVNNAAPSAGISGASYFSYVLSRDKIPAGQGTLVQVGRYMLGFLSFLLVLAAGSLILYFGGDIQRITVRIVLMLSMTIILLSAGLLFALIDRKRLDWLIHWLINVVDKVSSWIRKGDKPLIGRKRIEGLLNEFHEGFALILQNRQQIIPPFLHILASTIVEIGTIYLVFLAFGTVLNPGLLIIAYGAANMAGFNLLPAGIGSYEAAMVAVFATGGVPVALALSATLLYRVVNMVLYLPVGFYFYQKHLAGGKVVNG